MSCCCNIEDIVFVRGDVVELYLDIPDIEKDAIANVYLSCKGAKLLYILTYSNLQNSYCFRLKSEETACLIPGFYTYDITVELIDGNKITLRRNKDFIILKKKNSLCSQCYEEGSLSESSREEGD